ncbi:MAG: hypothetical protein QW179_02890 [Candidatus Hadarchaeales archaeon]
MKPEKKPLTERGAVLIACGLFLLVFGSVMVSHALTLISVSAAVLSGIVMLIAGGLLILSTFELQKPTTKAITLLGGIALLVGSGIQISSDWGGAAGGLGSLAIGILLIWIGVEIMKRGWKKYVAPAPSPPA